MSYSPKNKSKGQNPFHKNRVNNEEFLYRVKENISEEYHKAILSDNWSNYNFVYEMYYNYTLNGGNSRYISVVMKDYKNQYEKQQSQEIDELQKSCVKDSISAIYNCEAVTAETANKKLVEFNRQVYDTYMAPMAEAIEGAELTCHNIAETKLKSFKEMSKEEKIEFVNKEIDDLLDFIETNKQAKYNQFKKEFYNG